MPVTEVVTMMSTSSAASPAAARASPDGLLAEPGADLDEGVVGGAEAGEAGVGVQREREVPVGHAGGPVQPVEHRPVGAPGQDHLGEGVGDLLLRIAVPGQRRSHGHDLAHAAIP